MKRLKANQDAQGKTWVMSFKYEKGVDCSYLIRINATQEAWRDYVQEDARKGKPQEIVIMSEGYAQDFREYMRT